MPRQLQIAAGGAAVVAIVSISVFLYLTRGVALPSADIQTSVQQLDAAGSSATVYRIVQHESLVEYNIDEVINGNPKTVVGATNQIAGDIAINRKDLTQTVIGEIAINARTFATGDDHRDSSVARFVLQAEADGQELIVFQPTGISGLPFSANIGDTLGFQVTGDLTIAGTTQVVTFDVTAALETAERLAGHAETTILWSDFNLSIPSVPFVADVGDAVTLKLDFTASAVTADAT